MSLNSNEKKKSDVFVHNLSDVQTENIGDKTKIWQFTVVLSGAVIGSNCNICSHCFIENNVIIGDNVTIKNGVYLYDGITVEDNVFIGPNATFTNDKNPKSKDYSSNFLKTYLKRGVSIGAGAVILPGVIIGENALIGAGSIVTKDIPANSIVYGTASSIKK
jgi:UDP-2-acetamido-3-amino-2,3-dideoxy-glucuronate N-acetyltransferase